jgi:hypothetical protein
VEHIQRAIARFRRRSERLRDFDPDDIRDRKDPRIDTLEVAVEEDLAEAFGRGTPAYKNYSDAITLDTAGYNLNGTPCTRSSGAYGTARRDQWRY